MAAIQLALNGHVDKPSGIASGEAVVWNGTAWVRSSVTRVGPTSLGSGTPSSATLLRGDGAWTDISGQELATGQITADVTTTATSDATATTVVTSGSYTYSGTEAVILQFWTPGLLRTSVAGWIYVTTYEDTTAKGIVASQYVSTSGGGAPVFIQRRFTPGAGAHTYTAKVYVGAEGGGGTVRAGAGGSGAYASAFIRILRA